MGKTKRYAEGAKVQRTQRRVFNAKIAKGSKGERRGKWGKSEEKTLLRVRMPVVAPGGGRWLVGGGDFYLAAGFVFDGEVHGGELVADFVGGGEVFLFFGVGSLF